MSPKLVFLLTIILVLSFPFKTVAQKNMKGAAQLQNISSPNGLEGIVTETEETTEENETIYQIQTKPKESDNLTENSTENEEQNSDDGENESESGLFRIKL